MNAVTEEQAAKIWCPQVTSLDAARDCCLGTGCMAWRWHMKHPGRKSHLCENVNAKIEPPRPAGLPASWAFFPEDCGDPASWVEPEAEANLRRTGYCGLAGEL